MNLLSNSVLDYYLSHFTDLAYDKQFHFASRIYLWSQDDRLATLLQNDLKAPFTGSGDPSAAFAEIITRTQAETSHGSKNAALLRQPYFEKYPKLKMYVSLLFRLTFLRTIYGIDARPELFTHIDEAELADYEQQILNDPEAITILSTHAVNFLYLYRFMIKDDNTAPDPRLFLEIGRTRYDHSQKIHLQLLIYLYTHCILAESKFYYRPITHYQDTYTAMLDDLEKLIEEHFVDINLDNKFEYLACCKLMAHTSNLESRIMAEAEQSVSTDGTFLVDRHNNNPQITNNTLDLSEHRNVLFILANLPFSPLGAAD